MSALVTAWLTCPVHAERYVQRDGVGQCPTCQAWAIVGAANDDAAITADDEHPAMLDYNADGEALLVRHIAAALRAARP